MTGISVITCTGGRPEAFALCEKWMARQTVDWHEWVVVDDCDPPTKTTMGQKVVRPEPRWAGRPTLGRNLLEGFNHITGDVVVFIEDDDWYAPDYLNTQRKLIKHANLAGEGWARYYNVRRRAWMEHCNAAHASLMATACRVDVLPQIIDAIKNEQSYCYDLVIWRVVDDSILLLNDRKCVGMKAMPGRPGLAAGHGGGLSMTSDPHLDKLREWIGDDAEYYRTFSA